MEYFIFVSFTVRQILFALTYQKNVMGKLIALMEVMNHHVLMELRNQLIILQKVKMITECSHFVKGIMNFNAKMLHELVSDMNLFVMGQMTV